MNESDLRAMRGRVAAKKSGLDLIIGIDPGVNTGFAVWSVAANKLLRVESMKAVEAEIEVMNYFTSGVKLHVYVEDTRNLRLPKHMHSKGRERGAGSVARDMGRWQDHLEHHGIPHTMTGLSPKEFRVGDDKWFRNKTGWDKRTNDHGRCAAGVLWGKW